MKLKEAIQTYHDLLTHGMGAVSQEHMDQQLKSKGLYFGDRALCTVLRPRFLTPEQYKYLQSHIKVIMHAFDKIYRMAMADTPFRKQFGLLDWEEELIKLDPGYRIPSPLGRLDAFFATDKNQLLFTEYNAEVPAASAYNDVLTELFFCMPVMRKFMRHYEVRPLLSRHNVFQVLMEMYYQWGGREEPRIAILDWKEVPTYSEFLLFQSYFRAQGIACEIIDPRDVTYENGRLQAGDYHINLIYKRVLIDELVENGNNMNHPVVQAVRDRAVCMVNPFRCKVPYKKASLAVLTDERNAHFFTAEETVAISAHIPWTRRIEERHTQYRGQPVDLIPFISKYRDRFVLKPNDDYGGRGIILGWQATDEEWAKTIKKALEIPYVVQERIMLPTEPFPSFTNDQVHIYDRMLDTAPFIFYGSYVDGCLTRLATDPLLNVTAGGGSTVPTFVVEKR